MTLIRLTATCYRIIGSTRIIYKDNYQKFLITLDDYTGDHDGIQQINLIDWLS